MASLGQELRRFALPIVLFATGLFCQLVVLPSSFPPSHYDVLGVSRSASIEEIADAYQKLSSKWITGSEAPTVPDFVRIRYAYELLSNPTWKRDYDRFTIDEQYNVIEKIKKQYDGDIFSSVKLPLLDLDLSSSDFVDDSLSKLTHENFLSDSGKSKAWLIQVYSSESLRSAAFSSNWKRIAKNFDGVAETASVELGEYELASFLAERSYTGKPFFRKGLPALIAFGPNCRSLSCSMRYKGDLAVDAVVDWMASHVLGLPRILYYSKESLDQQFFAKSGRHKVKVLFFSPTGQRALPFLRKAAKDYHSYASFALVLWLEDDASVWFNKFEVESAPAFMFVKDPGVKPTVYYGNWNSSSFSQLMEQNKYQDLPPLRSVTSMELGCDARGASRAGNDTLTWYCVIVAGRPSWQLNRMREIIRRIQHSLSDYDVTLEPEVDNTSSPKPAVNALKQRRLTFAWLDGEAQSKYCSFYLYSETSYETCGSRKFGDLNDVPRIFLIRYKRNSTETNLKAEKKKKTVWDTTEEDATLASQLVARYNGSENMSEIIKWIAQTIKDGDSRNLPYFRTQTPELIPEDIDPVLLQGLQSILSNSNGLKHWFQQVWTTICDRMKDPRLGPVLLLGSCISFGSIWLQRSQTPLAQQTRTEGTVVQDKKGRDRKKPAPRRPRPESGQPSSIADVEPKDAIQLLSSDSDSD